MSKPVFELDGSRFDSLDGFYAEFGRVVGTAAWGLNLDAFNDVLRGGFGSPDGGFVLRWRNSGASREALGYAATVQYLERKIHTCHPTNVERVRGELEAARRGEGPTLFDILVEIIRDHCPDGDESESGIELELA